MTGATGNTGIGIKVAQTLLRAGARVRVGARDPSKVNENSTYICVRECLSLCVCVDISSLVLLYVAT